MTVVSEITPVPGNAKPVDQPADAFLLWILVWSELVAFGILLVAFLVLSVINAESYEAARQHLRPGLAAINTLVLLASGWQAALAARHGGEAASARKHLVGAGLFGLCFVAVKLFEYSREWHVAADEALSSFFELYFLITGFHLLHVLFGSALLFVVAIRPSRANVALITTLWHAIDLVWLVMFPILYLS